MAKKGGKSKGAVSAGIHSNVKASVLNSIRRDYMASGERLMNQLRAFRQRKNVMVTIENPNKNETNKRFIRVPATQVWKQLNG
jgi:F420-0:gamma-glutamyl ligase